MNSCAKLVILMVALVASARSRSIECTETCPHPDKLERAETANADVQPAASVNYVGGGGVDRGDGTIGDGGYVNQGVGLGGAELAGGVPGGVGLDGAFPLDFDGDHQALDRPPLGLLGTPGGGKMPPLVGGVPPGNAGGLLYTSIVDRIKGLGGIGTQEKEGAGLGGLGGEKPLAGLTGGLGSHGERAGGVGGPLKGLLGGGSGDGSSGVLGSLLGRLKGGQWGLYFGNVLMQAIGTLIKGAQEVLASQLTAGAG